MKTIGSRAKTSPVYAVFQCKDSRAEEAYLELEIEVLGIGHD